MTSLVSQLLEWFFGQALVFGIALALNAAAFAIWMWRTGSAEWRRSRVQASILIIVGTFVAAIVSWVVAAELTAPPLPARELPRASDFVNATRDNR